MSVGALIENVQTAMYERMLLRSLLVVRLYDLNFTSLRERAGTGISLSLSLPSLRGRCCWGHAANKLLGFALHFASPQVKGSDPPTSGVLTASSTGGFGRSAFVY